MSAQNENNTSNFHTFADWCLHFNDLSKESKHTVEVLLAKAGTSDGNKAEEILSNCTELDLDGNQIIDISPLSCFTNLTVLNLHYNQISDITPLSSLTNLKELYIGDNQISDISPLLSLTNLNLLNLRNNQISDVSLLSCFSNITKLYLDNNRISDINFISSLTNLIELTLANNQIGDIRPLSSLTNLTDLDFYSNQISDISPLKFLTNLQYLEMGNNLIAENNVLLSLRERWRNLYLKPIDKQKATAAVKSVYAVFGLGEPNLIFCQSPYQAVVLLIERYLREKDLILREQLSEAIALPISRKLKIFLELQSVFLPGENIKREITQNLPYELVDKCDYITPEDLVELIGFTEYCISALNLVLEQKSQKVLQCVKDIFEHCGWIFPLEKVCIVCDRPIQFSLDAEDRLHAEGSPAIAFADGFRLYSYHGVTLPEKYGQLHPHQWQAKWLLSEKNAEIRRVLIQGIGYARICQELQLEELDFYREYTLLKIDNDVDIEPIFLLKMTCPSTGFIHALRVPPEMRSAREAIRWVNWGIDPEQFSVET
ncbi:leucine-rich repeat domain-containing protein [Aerosakkonema funiforme]|uniref:Leucine-rich repeat domain-containing protein n=1 Tax=Aerosakkonema funiforme FACHB-1375 TaxID=2949571 RepID=A0A926ZL35_9CYAN|nr:leucine-rich repeat domain-containing protein [Aerosakkonema funiforme]MBD2184671.1 leucine-rich repeat domain-containing protein [Aerosakkonema funiforme FACHB-1375]